MMPPTSLKRQRRESSRPLFVVLLLSAAGLPGCGGEPPPRLVPVHGRVIYRNHPLPMLTVTFVPDLAKGNTAGKDARATTGPDGSFTVQTYPYGDGAMPGAYRVTVLYYSRNDKKLLPREYTKFYQTPFVVDVPEEGLSDLDLVILEDDKKVTR
jgi:hypothetical protein